MALFVGGIFFFFPAFLQGSPTQISNQDQTERGIIYISPQAVISGASQISNATIVPLQTESYSKKVVKVKATKSAPSSPFVAAKAERDDSFKKIQEVINKKVRNFCDSSQHSEQIGAAKIKLAAVAVSISSRTSKFTGLHGIDPFFVRVFLEIPLKQQYPISLALLPSPHLHGHYLRGPPFSV